MNVMFVTYDGIRTAGAKLLCYDYSRQLELLGFESSVFSFKDHLNARFDGPESHRTPFVERLSLVIRAFLRLLACRRKTIFIVHKAGFHSLPVILASCLKRQKIILFYDDFEYSRKSPMRNVFFALLLKRSAGFIAISRYLQAFLSMKTNKRVIYVPGGTETAIFRPLLVKKNEKVTFLWVGTLGDQNTANNILFLLDCFSKVRRQDKNTRLELRISGPYVGAVKKEIAARNMDGVEVVGWIDNLPEYLNKAHVGLFPLVEDNEYNRSKSPGKLFQYMACGLPVICSPVGECTKIVRNGKDGFLASDKKEFADKMLVLAKDKKLREAMGKSGRRRVARGYEKSQLAKRILGLAKDVQQERGSFV